jgi:type IV pilus assembly protein PilW
MSRQIENGRFAIDILSDDLRHAGFYGEFDFSSLAAVGALADTEHDPCSIDPTQWLKAMNLHIRGFSASDGGLTCLAGHNYKAGTDVLVVRRVRACAGGTSGCEALDTNKPYLQSRLCAADLVAPPHIGLYDAGTFTFKRRGTTPTTCSVTVAPIRQYLVHIYFISADNGANPAQSVPTLKRAELTGTAGGLAWVVTPLVEGIEQINIDYGIDYKDATGTPCVGDNCDGVPDAYDDDPATFTAADCPTTCTPENNWINVVTARVHVLARNIEPSAGYTDTKTYSLGSLTVNAQNDRYRRHAYTALVRMNNPAGRRDRP